ncbi:prepilin-type N-terminal cleavage/methylation domain-containing protein [Shewanella sp. 1CM18E]|uniref:prepilin-type N-terminal cleavage/methylation domain-containing protein n=1 Tax=Shewanella sp. 1CM18E TaxID=2929169 RepID=UPI0020BF48BF|nr:prepilin-type N-terminal cleavage/methylation domain-containing protein [Shewanella sp. 1CM18E]MCK8044265.1 prepilin-type N-terminal cleavage/methylation domain-containing protein [Shewanella sp. 1CM18E]
MRPNTSTQQGFTLVELLIALLISTTLIMGVSLAYTSINSVILSSKNIENAQEVLRFSAQTFTRSLKQASIVTINSPTELHVSQAANTIACDGSRPIAPYTEKYSLSGVNLLCDIGANPQTILTGVQNIQFTRADDLVSITITPQAQQGEPAGVGAAAPMQIDIALTGIILTKTTGA